MAVRKILWAAVMAAFLATGLAAAQAPRLANGVLGGLWSGDYTCSQGLTGMTVEVRPQRGDAVDATVTFYAHPRNPAVESGCYAARGTIDRATGRLVLQPTRWIYRPSESWSMTTLDGRIDANGGAYAGRIVFTAHPNACQAFTLRRNARPLKALPSACVTETPMS